MQTSTTRFHSFTDRNIPSVCDYQFVGDLFTDVFTDRLRPSAFPSSVISYSVAISVGNTKKPFADGFTDGICAPKKKFPAWNIPTDVLPSVISWFTDGYIPSVNLSVSVWNTDRIYSSVNSSVIVVALSNVDGFIPSVILSVSVWNTDRIYPSVNASVNVATTVKCRRIHSVGKTLCNCFF